MVVHQLLEIRARFLAQVNADHHPHATHLAHDRSFGQCLAQLRQQQFAPCAAARDDLFVLVCGDGCEPRRAGKRIAAKRAAVRSNKQRRLHTVAVSHRAHREPRAETLGEADHVRLQLHMLKPNTARAAKACLDLVDEQHRAPLAAKALRTFEKFRRPSIDTALALHNFHHDGGDLVVDALPHAGWL